SPSRTIASSAAPSASPLAMAAEQRTLLPSVRSRARRSWSRMFTSRTAKARPCTKSCSRPTVATRVEISRMCPAAGASMARQPVSLQLLGDLAQPEPGHVAELAPGPNLALAVQMDARAGLGQQLGPGLDRAAQQIVHHRAGERRPVAARQAAAPAPQPPAPADGPRGDGPGAGG